MITLQHMTPDERAAHRRAQVAEAMRRYRAKHPETVRTYKAARQQTDEYKAWRREYEARPDVIAKRRKRQSIRTDAHRAKDAEFQRNRRKNSPMRVICHRMSAMFSFHLKAGKRGKSWRAMVPYTPDELMAHLGRQFLPGMTWANIGEWEVDHILPVSSFSFTSESDPEFLACWGLPNLRPLWKSLNKAKGGKRTLLL